MIQRFNEVHLHPDVVSNQAMGHIFEELIRKFNEATNENPGEHFTPRDVIRLMVEIMLWPDRDKLRLPGKVVTVYDPACGTGAMPDGLAQAHREFVTANFCLRSI